MNASLIYEKELSSLIEENNLYTKSINQINAEQIEKKLETDEVLEAEKTKFRKLIIANIDKIAYLRAHIKAIESLKLTQEISGINA